MEKKIYVGKNGKKHLEQVFGCTPQMVWMALNFKSESDLARRIRHTALTQMGGVPNWKPEDVETTHEESEQTMTQTFGSRVKLVAGFTTGNIRVLVDGEVKREEKDMSIPEFMRLQREVEMMAMSL